MSYCDPCDRYFGSQYALDMHKRGSSKHNICCGRDFSTLRSMQQHRSQSRNHPYYCSSCDEDFNDKDELGDHYQESHDFCRPCWQIFDDDDELKDHYRQSEQHHYCTDCDRHFQNENNLRNHLNSSIHRPRNIRCPSGCGALFLAHSDLVLHLEAGTCSSGINRNTVNNFVRRHDTHHVITDPSHLITDGSADNDITYYATRAAWNGSAYECYLCHKDFSTLRGLNQHLASPAHESRFYICPGPSCGARFNALSALCQHIESEKCGVLRFKAVQTTMSRIFGQMKRLTVG